MDTIGGKDYVRGMANKTSNYLPLTTDGSWSVNVQDVLGEGHAECLNCKVAEYQIYLFIINLLTHSWV
jgi:hypothetical protein